MADISPFVASRYAPHLRKELASLLTPPYDVIDASMQDELHARHPYNLVRVDLGKEKEGDGETENKYSRAKKLWEEWNRQGIIERDPGPAIHVYEQEYELPRRGARKRFSLS